MNDASSSNTILEGESSAYFELPEQTSDAKQFPYSYPVWDPQSGLFGSVVVNGIQPLNEPPPEDSSLAYYIFRREDLISLLNGPQKFALTNVSPTDSAVCLLNIVMSSQLSMLDSRCKEEHAVEANADVVDNDVPDAPNEPNNLNDPIISTPRDSCDAMISLQNSCGDMVSPEANCLQSPDLAKLLCPQPAKADDNETDLLKTHSMNFETVSCSENTPVSPEFHSLEISAITMQTDESLDTSQRKRRCDNTFATGEKEIKQMRRESSMVNMETFSPLNCEVGSAYEVADETFPISVESTNGQSLIPESSRHDDGESLSTEEGVSEKLTISANDTDLRKVDVIPLPSSVDPPLAVEQGTSMGSPRVESSTPCPAAAFFLSEDASCSEDPHSSNTIEGACGVAVGDLIDSVLSGEMAQRNINNNLLGLSECGTSDTTSVVEEDNATHNSSALKPEEKQQSSTIVQAVPPTENSDDEIVFLKEEHNQERVRQRREEVFNKTRRAEAQHVEKQRNLLRRTFLDRLHPAQLEIYNFLHAQSPVTIYPPPRFGCVTVVSRTLEFPNVTKDSVSLLKDVFYPMVPLKIVFINQSLHVEFASRTAAMFLISLITKYSLYMAERLVTAYFSNECNDLLSTDPTWSANEGAWYYPHRLVTAGNMDELLAKRIIDRDTLPHFLRMIVSNRVE